MAAGARVVLIGNRDEPIRGNATVTSVRALTPALAVLALLASVGPASAALPTSPCPGLQAFGCATLSVPPARPGQSPGTVALSIRIRPATSGGATNAIVPLAGGPG